MKPTSFGRNTSTWDPRTPPDRNSIVTPTIATYNTGNYSLIVDGGMDNAFNNTETAFQALTPAGAVAPQIGVSSGYRNPRRNVDVGATSQWAAATCGALRLT